MIFVCVVCLKRSKRREGTRSYFSGSKFHSITSTYCCRQAMCELIIVMCEVNLILYTFVYVHEEKEKQRKGEEARKMLILCSDN